MLLLVVNQTFLMYFNLHSKFWGRNAISLILDLQSLIYIIHSIHLGIKMTKSGD